MRQLTVVLPALFLLGLLLAFELARSVMPPVAAIIAALGIGTLGVLAFSRSVFGVVARLQERLRRQNAQLRALNQASLMVTTNLSLEAVLQTVADSSRDLTNAHYAAIFIGRGDEIEDVVTSGLTPEQRGLLLNLRMDGLAGSILRSKRAYRAADMNRDPHYKGVPEGLPQSGALVTAPLHSNGAVIGHIFAADRREGEFTQEDQDALEALAVQASIAMKNASLYEEAEEAAVLKERERIGLDLHDGLIQQLYGIGLRLDSSLEALDSRPELVREDIDSAIEGLNSAIREVRSHIFDLRTNELEGKPLSQALSEMLRDLEVNSLMSTDIVAEGGGMDPTHALSDRQRDGLLQIAGAVLDNVRKHSHARNVRAEVGQESGVFRLRIVDDGIGMAQNDEGADTGGLRMIREQVLLLRGELRIETTDGGGTAVSVAVPIEREREATT